MSWHVHIDFTALGWSNMDKVWWTIAPALPNGQAYQPTEWQMVVSNWTVTSSPASKRSLKVAGPASVRIEEDSTWVSTSGYWEAAPGNDPVNGAFAFWSQGRAIRAAASGASVTIETHCQYTHDIYVGTRLDTTCGIVTATLDGSAPVTLDCYYPTATTSQTRRLLFSGVAAGQHKVVITLSGNKNTSSQGWYFYFDFLECAVASDVPDPVATTTAVAVATDFDTDNTYKLSPQRLVWNIQKLGLLGEIDHCCGVFWWKQSVASSPAYPQCTVTFSGDWNDQDVVWLHVGGSAIGKTVFGGQDNSSTIARHFANFINAIFDGVWASASGSVLTITSHSFGSVWQYHVYTALPASNTGSGQAAVTGDLQGGTYGVKWVIDPTQTPVLNRAFRDWNTDFFALLKANNMSVACSFSQELVQPPDNPAGGTVWVQRFPDGTAVETATGFGTLNSSQIAFSSAPQNYMGRAYAAIASLMLAAGLAPKLQFGEILWWFQANPVNKGTSSAQAQLSFFGDLGDPSGNGPLTLPLTFPQQPAESQPPLTASLNQTIPANASLIAQTAGPQTPPVLVGSAQLAATGAVDGFAIFHLIPGAQEAVVPMETRNASSYFLAFDNINGVVLAVAVANVSAQAASIGVVIRDSTGAQIGTPGATLTLAGNAHQAFVLPSQFPVTANIRGTIEFDTPAGGQISVLGIRTTPLRSSTTLTTIPALASVGTGGGSFAFLASGGDGWQTTFVLVNTGTSAAPATLSFLDPNGNPLSLPLAFPQSGSGTTTVAPTVTQTLAGGAMLTVQSAGAPALLTGSAQLTTSGNVSGFVIFRYNPTGQEAVVPLESRNAAAYLLAFDNTGGTATGIAVNNVSASSQTVNIPVVIRDDSGNQLATDSLPLAANGDFSGDLAQSSATLGRVLFPATANIRGTVEFDAPAGAQIGVIGIRTPATHTYTTLPALAK